MVQLLTNFGSSIAWLAPGLSAALAIATVAWGIDRSRRLRAAEDRCRTLIDSLDEGFCIIEMIFDRRQRPIDYRFLQINPSFERHTGLRDAVGKRMRELAPRHEEHWFTTYGSVALTGTPIRFQNRAEQLHRSYDVYAFRYGKPGTHQVAIFFRDVTAQRDMETALREAKEAAVSASLAKSEFLAHMSHEIRTPLNGVIGMTNLLLSTPLQDKQRRYAALANSSAESLTRVINDILDFSKIEAGKLEIVSKPFDLRETIEDAIDVLSHRAAEKGLEIGSHMDSRVPAWAWGDPDRLRQILINLVNNAIKFTHTGSVVVRLSMENDAGAVPLVKFVVTDTGPGIPADQICRLFKSFSQTTVPTAPMSGGTGLGLAISKQLVELMGGEIGVASELGKGSSFWFTLRLQEACMAATSAAPVSTASPVPELAGSQRVLVVDDNDAQREVVSAQLASWGFPSRTAEDSTCALHILTQAAAAGTPFSVAVIDADMPGIDGSTLAAAIKSNPALSKTVLMALLSMESDTSPERLTELGFTGWMTKPVRQSHLLDAIMDAVAAARSDDARTVATGVDVTPRPVGGENLAGDAINHIPSIEGTGQVGLRILVAEDNEINQLVTQGVLQRAGFRCDVVSDGQQAVDRACNDAYDLVLMDCQMPVLDGFQAARQIRKSEELARAAGQAARHIPIIALTASAMKGDRDRCLNAGMDGYASKPVNPQELVRTIAELVPGRSYAAADRE